ncbi:PLP-dependent aminotransferase family protein [Burkholderia vietnamiensis]|uniref:aminotransferase-like domain-containing protein n=1 Tax=Burkholderia vietnamiensis TaxID=60552 RepID=UPI0009C0333F|nr:PLP-dependent aminotransferase family protein [Burkholderia vietnamiensis]TPQ30815.1 PLP-dependent aminotransferase family protein [Burkholderia ubonensis]MDN7924681.1 PLP-dependent aminotransferase family protein [Burkholderia vietnamiensis]HDR9057741.1 PLP-dependent aminotransferase family protein [Burkholderia vietnamiensis]HDR9156057.1 PLP-dependent aminotransferase family protein [Burkholderia vietnamiensis]HDR9249727.1 PLP-dependent aminotransferase family protein [Burkholderia vietna
MIPLSQYQQIAEALRASIKAGTLPVGSKLPSVRALGKEHDVSVLTALQALRLLEQERWVEARPRSGFYVVERCDASLSEPKAIEVAPLDERAETHLSIVGTPCRVRLDLANGESALYPIAKLGILMRQLIYRDPELLGNHVRGTGYPALKQQIIRRAFEYGCTINPSELLITNGCIEAIALALRAVTRLGDGVAVESPTYFVILQMLRSLGLRAVEIPKTDRGIDLQVLENVLRNRQASAVICLANMGNPAGITLSMEDKEKLVRLVEQNEAVLIEDDIYGDTSFDGLRPKPLRSLSDKVILCSSFSKTLAPGIRVGWIASGRWSSTIASTKYTSTMGTPIYPQAAIAEFLRTGGYDLHLRRLRRVLQHQVSSMRRAVVEYFPAGTRVSEPSGGYVLWVTLPHGNVSTRRLFESARREGIGIAPGHLFATDDRFDNCFRLNAGFGWNDEVEKAIARLAVLANDASK